MRTGSPRLIVSMTQWGVGHGGFHTAEVRDGPTRACIRRYIYDCGSRAPRARLAPRVIDYVKGLRSENVSTIDVLYLSHFDSDHVNGVRGLSILLGSSIRVTKVVAPFLTPEERLLTLASSTQTPAFIVDLILAPVDTLTSLFPGSTVELVNSSRDDEGDDLLIEDDPPQMGDLSSASPGSSDIRVMSSGSKRAEPAWELIAHVQPAVSQEARDFWAEVQRRGLSSSSSPDTATIRTLIETQRSELRKLALELLGEDGNNKSSILLYSAPAPTASVSCFVKEGAGRRQIGWSRLPSTARSWRDEHNDRFGGWLSTGDARLEARGSVGALAKGLGKVRLDRVMVIAAPHHGSKYNSDAALWSAFPNAKLVTVHATGSSSHHPHSDVTDEIEQQHGQVFVVANSYDDISLECIVTNV